MKIKSGVWYWLAVASGCAGLVLGMGAEGTAQLTDEAWAAGFAASMAALMAAVIFARLGFAAEEREKRARRRYGRISRSHARNTEYPELSEHSRRDA